VSMRLREKGRNTSSPQHQVQRKEIGMTERLGQPVALGRGRRKEHDKGGGKSKTRAS